MTNFNIEEISDFFREKHQGNDQDFLDAINKIEEFRNPDWGDQRVYSVGGQGKKEMIGLKDDKYLYHYYSRSEKLYAVELAEIERKRKIEEKTGIFQHWNFIKITGGEDDA